MSKRASYACFGCVELIHDARTLAYHNWACTTGRYENASCVPKLNSWICACEEDEGDFTDPITDEVCWYDPLIPESADFLGVISFKEVSGLRASTFTREVLEGISGGSILQQPKTLGKQLVFEVHLLAATCAGMDYGIQWVRRQLEDDSRCPREGVSCASCQGQVLTIRTHCDPDALDTGLHTFPTAGTIDGISPIEDGGILGPQCCCTMQAFTFTIQTEDSRSFSPEPIDSQTVLANDPTVFGRIGSCADEVPTDPYADCCPFCPGSCDPCTTDPGCDCMPPFVLTPEVVGTTAPCFTEPCCRCISAICVNDVPHGYEYAFRLKLFAGYDAGNDSFTTYGLRNVVIRIFENPDLLPCPDDDATYDALVESQLPCAEIGVSWMPPASDLVIDGLTGRSWLLCDGACVDHSERVEVISGEIFPLLARCKNMVFTVEWDCLNVQQEESGNQFPSSVTVETYLGFKL